MTQNISPCKVLDNLSECLNAPAHCVPTVEYRLINFDLPIDNRQYRFFNLTEMNLFVDDPLAQKENDTSTSSNLAVRGLSLNAPFIMMGICIYAYGEPHAFALDGNWYQGQEALDGLARFPGSPTLLRNDAAYLARLGLPEGTVACQAQLDWGNPTWRAVWAFMHTYRIRVECPDTSTGEYILDDMAANIGNCCSHALPEGFGNSKTNWIQYVRTVNDRLNAIQNGYGLPASSEYPGVGGNGDVGYFFPFNVEQGFDAADAGASSTITPYRQPVDFTAFGREYMNATLEQWHRFSCPIPLDRESKLRVYFYRANGSDPYLASLLTELCMQRCIAPIAGNDNPVTLFEDDENPLENVTHESSTWTKVPGGKLRIGIGLKGFFVRPKVCADLTAVLDAQNNPTVQCYPCDEQQ